ncbi:hypothetical protein ACVMFA_004897 [Bradyrhizobium liaoningense]
MADDEDLAAVVLSHQSLGNFTDFDAVNGHAEHQKIGPFRVQNGFEFQSLAALTGDEAEVFQRLCEEGPKVFFAVRNACARGQLAMSEPSGSRVSDVTDVVHAPPYP